MDWFNPFTGLALSAFVIGVTGSIFAFWGWDTCLTLGEESKDPTKVPGRAGLLCVLSILLTYLLVAVAVMMYAGVGEEGLGLGNEENADNVFGALADPVLGLAGPLLFLAVFASSVASLQTTFLPAARAMLAMGAYGAFPERFAEVSPRYLVPTFATLCRRRYRRVLHRGEPAVRAGAAGYHCGAWHHDLLVLRHHRVRVRVVLPTRVVRQPPQHCLQVPVPVARRLMLPTVFVISVKESMNPENASGARSSGSAWCSTWASASCCSARC